MTVRISSFIPWNIPGIPFQIPVHYLVPVFSLIIPDYFPNYSASGNFITVNNNKTAGFRKIINDVKSNRPLCRQHTFGHIMTFMPMAKTALIG